ncbi:MAG: energy-coupled thiamine transporter ThiT [Candidatus Bathyarchaeia archaeon]
MNEIKTRFETKILAEIIVFAALSVALYALTLPFLTLPYGGSITAGSMIPIIWLSLRRGVKVGVFGGMIFGLVALPIDTMRLPFSPIVHPAQILLDYPIAFGTIGLAGFFKPRVSKRELYPLIGVAIATLGRFLAHFFAGIFFWSVFDIDGVIYSAVYNGSFLTGEFIIAFAIMYILVKKKILEIYI